MTTATKNKESKQKTLLPIPKGAYYTQKDITGTKALKETCSKEIQEQADYWFCKKAEEARAKDATKKAGEKLLQLMEYDKKTSIVVFDSEAQCKRRINILQGAEKLKVEKVTINE